MAKVKFKNPSDQIFLAGGEVVNSGNLTDEKYEQLIKLSPSHADQFEPDGVKEKAEKTAK